jgi:radical SAM superfamily enzyme YgiQ (UPF0313 family)
MAPRRVLFTTAYVAPGEYYDYGRSIEPKGRVFDLSLPRKAAYGLRFIKYNIPSIKILEYPTWEEYLSELKKGWDVVGFSFFLNETHEVLEMIDAARKAGVEEIWGGNYGALTDAIEDRFDRIFVGYAEKDIAKELGVELNGIRHPPIIWELFTSPGIKVNRFGVLFTTRGCPFGCSFCQTPAFSKTVERISLESLDEIFRLYKKMRITDIDIGEESFGLDKKHTEEVVSLLGKHNLYWVSQMRIEDIPDDISHWMSKGFLGVKIGIESFRQAALDQIQKKRTYELTMEKIKLLKKHNRFILGAYMLGYEDDTVESIKKDMKALAKLRLDMTQLCVITPLPKTPLWKEIEEKYGIFEEDYHKYDTKNLVWNHPNISPEEMRKLLNWALEQVRPQKMLFTMSRRMIRRYMDYRGILGGLRYVGRHYVDANVRYGEELARLA